MYNPHGKLQNRTKHCSFQTPCNLTCVSCLLWIAWLALAQVIQCHGGFIRMCNTVFVQQQRTRKCSLNEQETVGTLNGSGHKEELGLHFGNDLELLSKQ